MMTMTSISLDPGNYRVLFVMMFCSFPFCSDEEETEEKKRITEERLKAYHEKKSKKAAVIAKTSVLLDVKVWYNVIMS